MIFKGHIFLMSFPVEIILKKEKKERGVWLQAFQEYHNFPKAVALQPTTKQMCNLMARCITYFTMLVELLIIKNTKAVGVMLSTGRSSLTFFQRVSFIRHKKNKAYICAAAEKRSLQFCM